VTFNTLHKIRLFFRKDKESYYLFYNLLGVYPKDLRLYKQALIHKSLSIKDKSGNTINNERLEFLGDAILDAIVADIVFRKFNSKREGFLTSTRSKIVQRDMLNKVSDKIGLDKLIKYSHLNSMSSHNCNLSGNAFEALVGALYLDHGYEACLTFMRDKILKDFVDINTIAKKEVNFKSRLIEWTQKKHLNFEYRLTECKSDENSNLIFKTDVLIESIILGSGTGYSKKESQQKASKKALNKIMYDEELRNRLITLHEENPSEEEQNQEDNV